MHPVPAAVSRSLLLQSLVWLQFATEHETEMTPGYHSKSNHLQKLTEGMTMLRTLLMRVLGTGMFDPSTTRSRDTTSNANPAADTHSKAMRARATSTQCVVLLAVGVAVLTGGYECLVLLVLWSIDQWLGSSVLHANRTPPRLSESTREQ